MQTSTENDILGTDVLDHFSLLQIFLPFGGLLRPREEGDGVKPQETIGEKSCEGASAEETSFWANCDDSLTPTTRNEQSPPRKATKLPHKNRPRRGQLALLLARVDQGQRQRPHPQLLQACRKGNLLRMFGTVTVVIIQSPIGARLIVETTVGFAASPSGSMSTNTNWFRWISAPCSARACRVPVM